MKRLRNSRGSFIMQALVMVLLLAIIATGVMQMTMGRYTMARRVTSAEEAKQIAKELHSRATACLLDTGAEQNCAVNGTTQACFNQAIADVLQSSGRAARITFSGAPLACDLQVEVDD
jgi:hypothetical protein